jgi:hypothetical protein
MINISKRIKIYGTSGPLFIKIPLSITSQDSKPVKNVLTSIELNELGDVKGKKMLHLQCHFGMDS